MFQKVPGPVRGTLSLTAGIAARRPFLAPPPPRSKPPMTFHSSNLSRALAFVAFGTALIGAAQGQTYRERYPLADGASFDNLSVNLNLWDPSEKQLQQIVDGGFKFVRYELTWGGIEGQKGVYNWSVTDRFMARAKAKGLRVMALLAFSNPAYTTTGAPNTPESRAAYARFAAAAAARYKQQGVVWEIYNEPNLECWWKNPDPKDYVALVDAAADAIRAVSPEEWIVGLTTEILRADNRTYIETALSGGILTKLDGVGFHPYTDAAPETMAAQWAEARAMIEAKRPANRPIALMAGEVGYSRSWTGVTPDVQANLTVRLALFNLTQGIGLTNLYSYDDVHGTDTWHSTFGLTSYGSNVPYPVYYAVQQLTRSLKGYRFSKRLDLASDKDYCLLFSNPSRPADCRVVVWTTGGSHVVKIPSSAVGFSVAELTAAANSPVSANGFVAQSVGAAAKTIEATPAGLFVPTTGEPTLYASSEDNPLLSIAGAWAKLPGSVTLTTRADAINQLGAMIASPAWAAVPAGTTLKISDAPTPVAGYNRRSFSTTLSNLSSLTLDSPQVQEVFDSLAALQDETNAGRALSFTVQLPDGASVSQSASVLRKQPMSVFATMPQSGSLTLRVENPSGAPFVGAIKARSGLVEVAQQVRFGPGDTYKMFFFPTLTTPMITSSVSFDLYDSGANVLSSGLPVVESENQIVFRSAVLAASSGYSAALDGTANVAGKVSLAFGAADWEFLTGTATADISYSFGKGSWKCVRFLPSASLSAQTFAKVPLAIGMWVKGDGGKNFMRAQLVDAAGQTFQVTGGAIDWTGWKWVAIPVAGNLTQHWGGANDGIVRGAMRVTVPFLLDSSQLGTTGTVSLSGLTVIGQK